MLTTDYIDITLLRSNPFPRSNIIKRLTEPARQRCFTEYDFTNVTNNTFDEALI